MWRAHARGRRTRRAGCAGGRGRRGARRQDDVGTGRAGRRVAPRHDEVQQPGAHRRAGPRRLDRGQGAQAHRSRDQQPAQQRRDEDGGPCEGCQQDGRHGDGDEVPGEHRARGGRQAGADRPLGVAVGMGRRRDEPGIGGVPGEHVDHDLHEGEHEEQTWERPAAGEQGAERGCDSRGDDQGDGIEAGPVPKRVPGSRKHDRDAGQEERTCRAALPSGHDAMVGGGPDRSPARSRAAVRLRPRGTAGRGAPTG